LNLKISIEEKYFFCLGDSKGSSGKLNPRRAAAAASGANESGDDEDDDEEDDDQE
jgi:hypothetical protein